MAIIYDFETLGQKAWSAPVLSMGILTFDEKRLVSDNPYTFAELLGVSTNVKFDVKSQVEDLGRVIEPDTLQWWSEQSSEAQAVLKPSVDDMNIFDFPSFLNDYVKNAGFTRSFYSRGNNFDPVLIETLCVALNQNNPIPFYLNRDTRTEINLIFNLLEIKEKDSFIPDGVDKPDFVAHSAVHDIAADVMRLQHVRRLAVLDE